MDDDVDLAAPAGLREPRLAPPLRALAIRRAVARLCAQLGWSCLHEVVLPNARRADLLALQPCGQFICIEIKSCERDFLTDGKWNDYRGYADSLYFAVDDAFAADLLPGEAGLIVVAGREAEMLREAPRHTLAPARRRALLHRFATIAADRLARLEDPAITSSWRSTLRAD